MRELINRPKAVGRPFRNCGSNGIEGKDESLSNELSNDSLKLWQIFFAASQRQG